MRSRVTKGVRTHMSRKAMTSSGVATKPAIDSRATVLVQRGKSGIATLQLVAKKFRRNTKTAPHRTVTRRLTPACRRVCYGRRRDEAAALRAGRALRARAQ